MSSKPNALPENSFEETLQTFYQEFATESDRATAILGAAFLDEQLAVLLRAFLVDSKVVKDLVSGHQSPLGTFHARTMAAYAMGLISPNLFDDLCTIGQIRNVFAHQLHGITFKTPRIRDKCATLRLPVALQSAVGHEQTLTSRSLYIVGVVVGLIEIDMHLKRIQELRCKIPENGFRYRRPATTDAMDQ